MAVFCVDDVDDAISGDDVIQCQMAENRGSDALPVWGSKVLARSLFVVFTAHGYSTTSPAHLSFVRAQDARFRRAAG